MIKNKRILKFLASLVVCAYIFTNSGIILGEAFFENLDDYDDYDLLTLMIDDSIDGNSTMPDKKELFPGIESGMRFPKDEIEIHSLSSGADNAELNKIELDALKILAKAKLSGTICNNWGLAVKHDDLEWGDFHRLVQRDIRDINSSEKNPENFIQRKELQIDFINPVVYNKRLVGSAIINILSSTISAIRIDMLSSFTLSSFLIFFLQRTENNSICSSSYIFSRTAKLTV